MRARERWKKQKGEALQGSILAFFAVLRIRDVIQDLYFSFPDLDPKQGIEYF